MKSASKGSFCRSVDENSNNERRLVPTGPLISFKLPQESIDSSSGCISPPQSRLLRYRIAKHGLLPSLVREGESWTYDHGGESSERAGTVSLTHVRNINNRNVPCCHVWTYSRRSLVAA
jgi:hypothetical protein